MVKKHSNTIIMKLMSVAVILACLGALTGCQKKKVPDAPAIDLPEQFSQSGTSALPDKWWQSLNDEQLNTLIEEALGNNFSIRMAWDRLNQAEQIAIQYGANKLPSATYGGTASHTRNDYDFGSSHHDSYGLSLSLSYEVDLWGQIKSQEDAALFDAQAVKENLAAAAITLSSNVARTWVELIETKLRIEIIQEQIKVNQSVLDLVTLQFRKGKVPAADVLSQRQLVESSQGQLITSNQQHDVLQHQLAVLIGRTPGQYWQDQSYELLSLDDLPEVPVPSEVLQQRPDVQSAYMNVLAADKRVAVAIADQYPSLRLSGSVQTSDEKVRGLFENWLTNLAASITGPLFDAGLRKAATEAQKANLSYTINAYRNQVLTALQEVEDALTDEHYQRQDINNIQKQLDLSKAVYLRTKEQYVKGQLDYIRVLDSLKSQQQLELSELQARRMLIEKRIDLCKAIAGGWDMEKPAPATLN